ncbi:MAG: ABC transporter permease subunit, partial [Myxococcota bacterium]|nr:ABC transporter permease subunit [Myxococcota bacterium]
CPPAEEEAARCLGASGVRVLATVLWPRIRTSLSFALILVCMYVVSDFGAVAVLDCEVLTWALYKARGGRDAIVMGFGLMGTVLPLLAGVRLMHGEARQEVGLTQRTVARSEPRRLAHCLTWTLVFLTAGLGVLLPAGVLVEWLISGVRHGIDFAPVAVPALWTLIYGGLGATVVLVLGFVPAYLATKMSQRQSGMVENLIYLTSSVPGILIAVGLLQLIIGLKRMSHSATWIDDSVGVAEQLGIVLLIGYGMRFLSQAYASLKPTMQRLDIRQSESARILGATPTRRWFQVTLPAMSPGLIAAFTILFLSIAKELPITLMLIPLGQTTLAYRIFDAQQEGALPDVGLAGLTLLFIALILQVTVNRRRAYD